MQHPKLTAQTRKTQGKKVKQLRRSGNLPANIFGKHIESKSIQVKYTDFLPLYKQVGETGIIDLTTDGATVPVLVKNLQFAVLNSQPVHVDFFQVNLKEKIKTYVPIKLVGESPMVADKQGLLLQILNEVEIEALPEQLPEAIEADTTSLLAMGEMLEVSDITPPEGVVILTDPEQVVAQISELVSVQEPEPVAEVPADGQIPAPVEGEAPAETQEAAKEEVK